MDVAVLKKELELIKKHVSKLEAMIAAEELPPAPAKNDTYRTHAIRVMQRMNEILGARFSTTADGHLKHIVARLREGKTIGDFEAVIRDRKEEWGKDPKMCVYLRPSTLFGSNFDSYLCAADNRSRPQYRRSYDADSLDRKLMEQMMEE